MSDNHDRDDYHMVQFKLDTLGDSIEKYGKNVESMNERLTNRLQSVEIEVTQLKTDAENTKQYISSVSGKMSKHEEQTAKLLNEIVSRIESQMQTHISREWKLGLVILAAVIAHFIKNL